MKSKASKSIHSALHDKVSKTCSTTIRCCFIRNLAHHGRDDDLSLQDEASHVAQEQIEQAHRLRDVQAVHLVRQQVLRLHEHDDLGLLLLARNAQEQHQLQRLQVPLLYADEVLATS